MPTEKNILPSLNIDAGGTPSEVSGAASCIFPSKTERNGKSADAGELHAIVKWTLDREDDAANTIQHLVSRIDDTSELSQKARSYAAELRHQIARLKAQLPPNARAACGTRALDEIQKPVGQSLDAEHATAVLIRFLLQHAETTCEILMSAGDRLNSKAVEMLWKRAERERRKIADWIKKQESLAAEKRAQSRPSPSDGRALNSEAASSGEALPQAANSQPNRDEALRKRLSLIMKVKHERPQSSSQPRQIVRWM